MWPLVGLFVVGLLLSLCISLFSPLHVKPAHAAVTVPTKVNFQGRLTDNTGNIKPDGTYNMRLRLYTVSTGGTAAWTEDRLVSAARGVQVTNGLFAIQLGDYTAIPSTLFTNTGIYLEVELATPASATTTSPVWTEGAMTPRSQLAASAYAFNADLFDGLDAGSFVQTSTNNTFTGTNLFKPTTDTSNAFTIQNSLSQVLFSVDTNHGGTVSIDGTQRINAPWTASTNSLPVALVGHASVTANGYAYAIGGGDYTATVYYNTVYYAKLNANGSTGAWQTTTALPVPEGMRQMAAVTANGYIYVMGGFSPAYTRKEVYSAKLNTDGTIGAWRQLASLPTINSFHRAVVGNGYIYTVGGNEDTMSYSAKLNADGTLGQWKATTAIPETRLTAPGVAMGNGRIYVTGGQNATATISTVRYATILPDGQLSAWQATTSMNVARYYHTTVISNGYLYILGGGVTNQYAKINPNGTVGSWTNVPQGSGGLPGTGRQQHTSFVANGFGYVVGGNDSTAAQTSVLYSRLGTVAAVGGSLDLVGLQGQNLTDAGAWSMGSIGGSVTAGNVAAVGTLQVQGQSMLNDAMTVKRDFTVGDNVLAVDDNNAGTVTLLGSASGEVGEWKNSTVLPANRVELRTVTANGYIYALGGTTNAYDPGFEVSTVYYAKLNADGTVSSWNTTTSMPVAMRLFQVVSLNGYLYIVGGRTSTGSQKTVYRAKLNPDGTIAGWVQDAQSLPEERYGAVAAVVNGRIYIAGGTDTNELARDTTYFATVKADGSIGSWTTTTANSGNYRTFAGGATANGYLYVIGGFGGFATQSSVYYAKVNSDGTVGSWSSGTNYPIATQHMSAVIANGRIYGIGSQDTAEIYSAKLNTDGSIGSWVQMKNLPESRYKHASAVANGYLYTLGGMSGPLGTRNTVLYARLGGIVNVGGSLDLVGLQGGTLADGGGSSTGSSGGSLTAGNITAVGTLQVQSEASFANTLSVGGSFSAASGLFSVSRDTNVIRIGSATPDTTGVVLVLDSSSGADPATASDGSMYYQTTTNKFRCRESGVWKDCVQRGYTLNILATAFSPADASNYWGGSVPAAPATTIGQYKMYVRKAGTIRAVNLTAQASGAGSTEPWGLAINKNGTNVITPTPPTGPSEWTWAQTGLSIPVAAGDYLQFATTTPTWATNPTGVTFSGYIYIE